MSAGRPRPTLPTFRGVFSFVVSLCGLAGGPLENPFTEMAGMFFDRVQDAVLDVIYNVDPQRKAGFCGLLQPCLEPVFVKSRLRLGLSADQAETVERFREAMVDFVVLLDLFSDHGVISVFFRATEDLIHSTELDANTKAAS